MSAAGLIVSTVPYPHDSGGDPVWYSVQLKDELEERAMRLPEGELIDAFEDASFETFEDLKAEVFAVMPDDWSDLDTQLRAYSVEVLRFELAAALAVLWDDQRDDTTCAVIGGQHFMVAGGTSYGDSFESQRDVDLLAFTGILDAPVDGAG